MTALFPLPVTNESPRPTQRICGLSRPCMTSHEAVCVQTHIRALVGDSTARFLHEVHLCCGLFTRGYIRQNRARGPHVMRRGARAPSNLLFLPNAQEAKPRPRMAWSEQGTSDGCALDGEVAACAPMWRELSRCDAAVNQGWLEVRWRLCPCSWQPKGTGGGSGFPRPPDKARYRNEAQTFCAAHV